MNISLSYKVTWSGGGYASGSLSKSIFDNDLIDFINEVFKLIKYCNTNDLTFKMEYFKVKLDGELIYTISNINELKELPQYLSKMMAFI